MMSLNSSDFSTNAACNFCRPGINVPRDIMPIATCIAVGNVSFDDCPMLQWSLGCTGIFDPISPPNISMARFEMTSFAFMLDWVPDPVCQTTNGKLSSNLPSITSWAAAWIALPRSGSISPWATFAMAQAFLITPSARMIATGWRSHPIGKFIMDRCVCAPQYLSAGTSSGPKLSVSIRISAMVNSIGMHLYTHYEIADWKSMRHSIPCGRIICGTDPVIQPRHRRVFHLAYHRFRFHPHLRLQSRAFQNVIQIRPRDQRM